MHINTEGCSRRVSPTDVEGNVDTYINIYKYMHINTEGCSRRISPTDIEGNVDT
jgi:hypothetical protein